jgi:hypothetical protein
MIRDWEESNGVTSAGSRGVRPSHLVLMSSYHSSSIHPPIFFRSLACVIVNSFFRSLACVIVNSRIFSFQAICFPKACDEPTTKLGPHSKHMCAGLLQAQACSMR